MEIHTIVLTTDYSEGSAVAAPVAASLARSLSAELVVVHVAERLVDVVPVAAGIPPVELEAEGELDARAREKLKAWADGNLPDDLSFRVELVEGAASEEIVELARRVDGGMIVMGTQGHSRLERFFTGSVTESVVRHATVPVLVVPAPRRGRREENEDT